MDLSYVHGTSDIPLKYQTIGQAFDETAGRFADREALVVVHQGVRWSYAELAERVAGLAAGLLALGLNRGDRIGIWAPNCSEWVMAQFASAKAGLTLVNINPAYRRSELEYCLQKVGCRALISAERLKSSDYLSMLQSLIPEADNSPTDQALNSSKFPALDWLIRLGQGQTPGFLNFDGVTKLGQAVHHRRLTELQVDLQADDAANIQFTSGTTGMPKGATLSHHNILNNGYFVGRALHLTEHDRICIPVPLYHCFGMVMGNLAAITHGATMIYPAESFDPKATLDAVAKERASALYGVPTMFIAELEQVDFPTYDLTSLRTGIMAGSPCPVAVMKRVIHEMHIRDITICYGMTETSPVSFQSSTADALARRVSTVGRVHPHIEAKVVDTGGRCVPRGIQGELHTRGYSVMKGYWSDSQKTREVLDDAGWMHTGDLGVIDEEGYCTITGRLKDVVIRGGENIYPREIEEFLQGHPKIQSVHVCGVPDRRFGEEVCAWIQLKSGVIATDEEIRAYCRERIAYYKTPRYVRFVQAFPMTATGKVQKYLMREETLRELGLSEQPPCDE